MIRYIDIKDANGKPLGWLKFDPSERLKWIALGAYGRIGEFATQEEAERSIHMNDMEMVGTV